MPNWPLGAGLRQHLIHRLNAVGGRPVILAKTNIPLTVHQIQHGGLNLTEEQLGTLKQLWGEGVQTIDRTSEIRLAFLQEQFPELRRGVVLFLKLPEVVFTGRATMYGMGTPRFDPSDSHYIVPKFDNLTPDERAQLITWLDRVIRQERMNEVLGHCVEAIVRADKITPTIAHLTAIWPAASSVLDPNSTSSRGEREMIREWKERFRNPPLRNRQLYTPDTEFMVKWSKLLKIADVQLVQGLMLEQPKHLPGTIRAQVENWQRIDGDITF